MSDEDVQMKIRVPIELKDKIEALAKKNKRSMNAEILHMIEDALHLTNVIPMQSELIDDGLDIISQQGKLIQTQSQLLEDQRNEFNKLVDSINNLQTVLKSKITDIKSKK